MKLDIGGGQVFENFLTQLSVPLVLILSVVAALAMRRFSRGAKQRQHNADAAQVLGMRYETPVGGDTHHFSGTTRQVPWVVETVRLVQENSDTDTPSSRLHSQSCTRWTASLATTGGGGLLLMNLPKGVPSAIPAAGQNSTGILASIAAKAASLALQGYLLSIFGGKRIAGLQLKPEHRLALPDGPFAQSFAVFCDNPALVERLDAPVRDWLLWAYSQHISVLWDDKGLTLTWPTPYVEPLDITVCADSGAALAGLLLPRFADAFYQLPQGDSPYTKP